MYNPLAATSHDRAHKRTYTLTLAVRKCPWAKGPSDRLGWGGWPWPRVSLPVKRLRHCFFLRPIFAPVLLMTILYGLFINYLWQLLLEDWWMYLKASKFKVVNIRGDWDELTLSVVEWMGISSLFTCWIIFVFSHICSAIKPQNKVNMYDKVWREMFRICSGKGEEEGAGVSF